MNRILPQQFTLLTLLFFFLLLFPLLQITCTPYPDQIFSNYHGGSPVQQQLEFNGTQAFAYLEDQCAFGPRPPGSSNLTECGNYIIQTLEDKNWVVETQTWTHQNTQLRNILAGASNPHYVLLAHYDTRPVADSDPDPLNRSHPILGANDGASGVAVLMELADVLPEEAKAVTMLLFVDAEDSGNYDGWDWIVGSTYFVNNLTLSQKSTIRAVILLDMIGDNSLQLPRERSSTPDLVDAIWQTAADLNYEDVFLDTPGPYVIDDHRPFLDAGIPAVDIIDFTYPFWHTLEDTPDKCSSASLEIVGRVVEAFMETQLQLPTYFTPTGYPLAPGQLILLGLIPLIIGVLIIWIVYKLKFQKETD